MNHFESTAMRSRIDTCLKKVQTILENNRESTIQAAGSVSHEYSDKFLLVDTITNITCAAQVHCFAQIGLTKSVLKTLKTWSANKAVTLKFSFTNKSTFVRALEREVEGPTSVRKESSLTGTEVMSVVTKVKEFVTLEKQTFQLVAFTGVGDNPAEFITILDRSGSVECTSTVQSTSTAQYEDENEARSYDVNLSWLLRLLSPDLNTAEFCIDRAALHCFTPTHNHGIDEARLFFRKLNSFCSSISHEVGSWKGLQPNTPKISVPKVVFSPVVPLFEARGSTGTASDAITDPTSASTPHREVALSSGASNALLGEFGRELTQMCAAVAAAWSSHEFPSSPLFGAQEEQFRAVLEKVSSLCADFRDGVDYVEDMVRRQLVAAIGKEISTEDFAQYMTFHNRKVFKEAYQPKPFSFAVRRSPLHSPEGQIQIETANVSHTAPIITMSQHTENAPYMEFALNATTTVKFGGERHLHGWMAHHFSNEKLPELKLVAQARQFSSYIVLIGRIASAKLFQPKHGFILQNKDEFRIPLDLEQIPTAKEFKRAVSSLSPEQQRFAKSFRSMQLESTLFGVCVIQIKPQLEKVLKLQADSLTKEIKLTQDLMQLFIKYQIPSDLLSFQGAASSESQQSLLAVKGHAQALQGVLLAAKEEEVAEAQLKRGLKRGRDADSDDEDGSEEEDDEEWGEDDDQYWDEADQDVGEDEDEDEDEDSIDPVRIVNRAAVRCSSSGPPARKCSPTLTSAELHARAAAKSARSACARRNHTGDKADESQEQVEAPALGAGAVDFTVYPALLEEMYTQYDPASSLRPTIINTGSNWKKTSRAGLLSAPVASTLSSKDQETEKVAAFDLLDALTRSGALPIEHASLHVIIAATHCFDDDLMDTVVQKNVNPIERVERSTLIMAAALNGVPASELVTSGQLQRVSTFSPMLFPQNESVESLMNE